MKKRKATLITLLGIVALALASVATFAPNQTHAQGGGDKQPVIGYCLGHSSTYIYCEVGNKNCTPTSCSSGGEE